MSFRGQQNEPMPSITKADNLDEPIIDIRRSQVSLHIARKTYKSLPKESLLWAKATL
jgi:hypothetical protein